MSMQLTGILRSWNDDKGYGFIAPAHGGPELFAHISAFARDGTRPTVGETLSFELGRGANGKPQAVRVTRQAVGKPASHPRESKPKSSSGLGTLLRALVGLVLLVALGTYGYQQYAARAHRLALEAAPAVGQRISNTPEPVVSFRCDGRKHCSQMTSCQEATWFINHCPGTEMDGNHDGVPCEQQLCTGGVAR
jgi:cold shock CspA family protein